jgi:hypothetical protein
LFASFAASLGQLVNKVVDVARELGCAAHQKPTTSAHEKSTRLGTQIRIAMGKG